MKMENYKISGMLWGLALAASALFAGCGSDSSSGAVNGGGTSDVSYGEMTDARDGQVYKTVVIGSQTWMAENLNYATDSSWCYENSADSCSKYGRLYQWAAAMNIDVAYNYATWGGSDADHRGVCPSGWHLPSNAEWTTLETYVSARSGVGEVDEYGDWSEIGALLKSADGLNDGGNGGTDAYGFSALPAGNRIYSGDFINAGSGADFWSATEIDAGNAYERYLGCDYADMSTGGDIEDDAFSVRCLKDF